MAGRRRKPRSPFRRVSASRMALAAAALLLAGFGVADSFANVAARVSAPTAHRFAPWDGKIAAKLVEKQFQLGPEFAPDSAQASLARSALRAEPTAVEALNVMGLQAQLRSETETTRRIFSQSLALSRREFAPRIWAIEEAVNRGDIDEALANYDIALRTSNRAYGELFPVLSSAIAEPRIRAKLLEILADKPIWLEDFMSYAARVGQDPEATAQLFREGARIGLPIDDEMRTALVDSFAEQGKYAQAWAYYETIRPGARRTRSRDPDFTFSNARVSLFDWVVTEYGSIQRGEKGGLVDFSLPSTVGGAIVAQAQFLPPGTYRLTGTSSGIEQRRESLPYWSLKCGDSEFGRVQVPNSTENNGRFAGVFRVPPGCPLQTLVLMARPTEEYRGVTGQITRVQLEPSS